MPSLAPNSPAPLPAIVAAIGTVGTGKAVSAADAGGNSATLPADVTFTSSDPSILSVVDHGDGTATVTPHTLGAVNVTIASASTGVSQVQPFKITAGPPVTIQVQWTWTPG